MEHIKTAAAEAATTTVRDVVLSAFAVATAGIPIVGGVLSRLVDEIPRDRHRRQMALLDAIVGELTSNADRLDVEFLGSDEFATMVEEVLERGGRRRELDKREYYARLLAGAATPERPGEAIRFRYIDTLDRLRPRHLRLLHAVSTTHNVPAAIRQKGDILEAARWALRDALPGEIWMDWGDLEQLHLVSSGGSGWTDRGNLAVTLTELGYRFTEMLRLGPQMPLTELVALEQPTRARESPGTQGSF